MAAPIKTHQKRANVKGSCSASELQKGRLPLEADPKTAGPAQGHHAQGLRSGLFIIKKEFKTRNLQHNFKKVDPTKWLKYSESMIYGIKIITNT